MAWPVALLGIISRTLESSDVFAAAFPLISRGICQAISILVDQRLPRRVFRLRAGADIAPGLRGACIFAGVLECIFVLQAERVTQFVEQDIRRKCITGRCPCNFGVQGDRPGRTGERSVKRSGLLGVPA